MFSIGAAIGKQEKEDNFSLQKGSNLLQKFAFFIQILHISTGKYLQSPNTNSLVVS